MNLFVRLLATDPAEVTAAYERWAKTQANNDALSAAALGAMGYEEIIGLDPRLGFEAYGRRWAYKHDAPGKSAGLGQPSNPAAEDVCRALIDGQLCGGTLIRAAVCPRCALGKSGVSATLTCDVCGHVTAVMRGGK